jgi:hypothetical protein
VVVNAWREARVDAPALVMTADPELARAAFRMGCLFLPR